MHYNFNALRLSKIIRKYLKMNKEVRTCINKLQ